MTSSIKIISKEAYEKTRGKPNQEEVWDSIAHSWGEYRQKSIPLVAEFLQEKSGTVIDLGCGSGRNMIPSKKITYYGVDFSKNQMEQAKKYTKKNKIKARFIKSDITTLPKQIFKSEIFDYGLFIASLHCLETAAKRKAAVAGLFRVLKPGAEALITIWNSDDKRFNAVDNHGSVYLSWKEEDREYFRYYYLFKKPELIRLLEEAGFSILEEYPREKDRFSRKNFIFRVKK